MRQKVSSQPDSLKPPPPAPAFPVDQNTYIHRPGSSDNVLVVLENVLPSQLRNMTAEHCLSVRIDRYPLLCPCRYLDGVRRPSFQPPTREPIAAASTEKSARRSFRRVRPCCCST